MPWFEIARVVAHVLLWSWAALGVVMVLIYLVHLFTKPRRPKVYRYEDGRFERSR